MLLLEVYEQNLYNNCFDYSIFIIIFAAKKFNDRCQKLKYWK